MGLQCPELSHISGLAVPGQQSESAWQMPPSSVQVPQVELAVHHALYPVFAGAQQSMSSKHESPAALQTLQTLSRQLKPVQHSLSAVHGFLNPLHLGPASGPASPGPPSPGPASIPV
jgi:hypothetical protein